MFHSFAFPCCLISFEWNLFQIEEVYLMKKNLNLPTGSRLHRLNAKSVE